MKKVVGGLLLFLFAVPALAQSSDRGVDVIIRLKQIDVVGFKMAVEDIEKTYGNKFDPKTSWQEALSEIDNSRNELIKKISAADKKAETHALKLLAVLDKTLLSNPLIRDKKIMAIKRHLPGNDDRIGMGYEIGLAPSNFQNNSEIGDPQTYFDNEFVEISGFADKLSERIVYKPKGKVIVSDPEISFNGKKVLYSSIGDNGFWQLFELSLEDGSTRQITPATYEDFDSFDGAYTPDGRIVFCATATFLGLPCTDGGNKMCGMFLFDPATGTTRQLTFDQDSNWSPVIMNNGQVLYQRWEYADLPHSNSRIMFTMNPDGTSQQAYYGTNSYFPTAFFNARPIPGHGTAIVGTVSGHHSISRSGRLMIIDPMKGRKEAEGVVAEIPHRAEKVVPIVRDRLPDGVWPSFLTPYPLNEKYFITIMKSRENSLWGIYLVDVFNNLTLIKEQEGVAFIEPFIVEAKNTPPVIPDRIKPLEKTATVFMQDVYFGGGLKGIPRGAVKKLRIGSYGFSPLRQGGLLGTIGMDGPWDIKRILGEVDVESDGSVMFTVPANTPIFVQPLDEQGKALQIMRSWFTAMPGETLSCIGCHEDRSSVPIPKPAIATKRAPQQIKEFYGAARGVGFKYEIQPILDRACVGCHEGKKPNRPYLKGDKMISDWSSDIAGHAETSYGGKFSLSYADLHRYVRRGGIESDMDMLTPMDFHADQTELMQILNKGHYGVQLTKQEIEKLALWIDFNAPYHGRRSDIPTYDNTKIAYQMRAKYAKELFGIEEVDLEVMPEITANIVYQAPKPMPVIDKGLDSVSGFPFYKNANENAWSIVGFEDSRELAMKSIPLTDKITLELMKMPKGSFLMGSINNPDEMPRCKVDIEKAYWVGKYEVTNEMYALFDKEHNSRTEHRHGYQFGREGYPINRADQPVVRVSWQDAMDFCAWLSEKTGQKFTLPTEAQWEWAARAGTAEDYYFGNIGSDFTNFANLGDIKLKEFAACTSQKNYESTRIIDNPSKYDDWIPRDTTYNDGGFVSEAVGRYRPNIWDLYDMHGNVWEWTLSSYKPYPYIAGDGRNDIKQQDSRVVRGGSWYDRPHRATSSFRLPYREYQKVYNVGFRVVMQQEE